MSLTQVQAQGVNPSSNTISTSGNIDNLDFNNAPVLRMTNSAKATITGFKAGADGQLLTLLCRGTADVDIAFNSANSIAANRIVILDGGVAVPSVGTARLRGGNASVAQFIYDGSSATWRQISSYLADYVFETTGLTASPVNIGYGAALLLLGVTVISPTGDRATFILTAQGGAGVAWLNVWLGPGTKGTNTTTWTMNGTAADPYTLSVDTGSGGIFIQRGAAGTIAGTTVVLVKRLM